MAYSVVPLVTTGDEWTAAQHNTYIKDNFASTALGKIQASGDLIYASGSNVIDRLAYQANSLLTSGSAAPQWLACGDPLQTLRSNIDGTAAEFGDESVIGEVVTGSSSPGQTMNGSAVAVEFNAANIDVYSMWSAGAPTKVTIPATFPDNRWYRLVGYFKITPNNTSASLQAIGYRISGAATFYNGNRTYRVASNTWDWRICLDEVAQLSADDYVELMAQSSSGYILKEALLAVIMIK